MNIVQFVAMAFICNGVGNLDRMSGRVVVMMMAVRAMGVVERGTMRVGTTVVVRSVLPLGVMVCTALMTVVMSSTTRAVLQQATQGSPFSPLLRPRHPHRLL